MTSPKITTFIFLGLASLATAGYTPDMYPTTNNIRSTNPPARTVWYQPVTHVVSNWVCTNYVPIPIEGEIEDLPPNGCFWRITTNTYWDNITPWAPTNEIVTSTASYRVLVPTNDPDYDIPYSNFWATITHTTISVRTYSTNVILNGPDLWAYEAFASISERVSRVSISSNLTPDIYNFWQTNRQAIYPRLTLMRSELANLKEIARSLNVLGCFFMAGRPKRFNDAVSSPGSAEVGGLPRHEPSPIDVYDSGTASNNNFVTTYTNLYRFYSDPAWSMTSNGFSYYTNNNLSLWTWEMAYLTRFTNVFHSTNGSPNVTNIRNMFDWEPHIELTASSNEFRQMNQPKTNTMAWAQAFEFLNAMTSNALVPAMSVATTCGTQLWWQNHAVIGFTNTGDAIDRSFIFLSSPTGDVQEVKSSSMFSIAGDARAMTNVWAFHADPNAVDAPEFNVLWFAPKPNRDASQEYYSKAGSHYTSFGWTYDNQSGDQNVSTGTGPIVLRMILDSWKGPSTSQLVICDGQTNTAFYWPQASNPIVAEGRIEFINCGVYSAQVCRADEGQTTNLANHTISISGDGDAVDFNVSLYSEITIAFTNPCGVEYSQQRSDGGVVWVDFYMDFRESARGSTNGTRGTWKLAPDYEWRY